MSKSDIQYSLKKAMPWLGWLVASLSADTQVCTQGFVMDKVALGQIFFRVLCFSPVSIIPPWLSILTDHLVDK
jgi:hypothetical protein